VIFVALKTPQEIRLGICIYKTTLEDRPDDYIGFTPSCPPHFTTKLRPYPYYILYPEQKTFTN